VLIHFPIALFPAAVVFDYLAQWMKNRALAAAAYFNLLLAAVFTVPVVAMSAHRPPQVNGNRRSPSLRLHVAYHGDARDAR
jgi:uncharacterized membrane protein